MTTVSATVLSKPNCAPCTWVKRTLEQHGIEYVDRDVTTDPAAEALVRELYDSRRPGQMPATPVTLLVTDEGTLTVFGPDIRSHLKQYARAAAAA
ncbi:glutaredoxin family protein [Mycobacteroides chelonae]|uniref:glutaredoxin family protein n=1 Tax=Mycobacteroides chelonae TaxID=1774 RepID=UPI0018B06545|nr:glutaredoxin family protein [Mycobacteroides chelonae]MBF9519533.1 glutaredoxin family protein [Mycobacteroides chelonae]